MGFSHSDLESESKKWVIAGISVRSLKPINTKRVSSGGGGNDSDDDNDNNKARSTTPTAKDARIPDKLPCPPAPRKRRQSRCSNNLGNGVREFFNPPDLESVFKCHVEKAK